jgi:hypothetical protein
MSVLSLRKAIAKSILDLEEQSIKLRSDTIVNYVKKNFPQVYKEFCKQIDSSLWGNHTYGMTSAEKIRHRRSIEKLQYERRVLIFGSPGACELCKKVMKIKLTKDLVANLTKPWQRFCSQHCARNSPETINRRNSSVKEKFGVDNVFSCERIKRKIRRTHMRERGVYNVSHDPAVREKTRQTNQRRRGVDYPMQDPEVYSKRVKTLYSKSEFCYKGKVYTALQGYEPRAVTWLVDRGFIVSVKKPPSFWYQNDTRRYHPDLWIKGPSGNKYVVEVKSRYTAGLKGSPGNKSFQNLQNKAQSVIALGYRYKLLVIEKDVVHHFSGVPDWDELQSTNFRLNA